MRRIVIAFVAAAAATGFAQSPKKDAVKPAAAAQAATPAASVSELNEKFDRLAEEAAKKVKVDRLAALESYLGDKKNAEKADVLDGRIQAGTLAMELEKFDVAKTHAEKAVEAAKDEKLAPKKVDATLLAGRAHAKLGSKPEVVKGLLMGLIDGADQSKPYTLQAAFNATNALSDYLVGVGDKDGAVKAWETLTDKIPDESLGEMAKGEIETIKLIGEEPKAFPADAKDTEGKPLSLADYKGKVLLIDFWATWCGPCMVEMPNVVAAYKKYQAKGFEVVGISLDNERSLEKMADVVKEKGMTWRQFADGKGWESEIGQLYGVRSIPATYLLDRDGKVHRMGLRGKELEAAIEKLLAAPAKK